MKILQIWILCSILLLTACGSNEDTSSQPSQSSQAEAVESASLDTPEGTMSFYVAACESGDTVSAREAVGHNFQICEFPEDAISSQQSGDFEINGKTARVVWQWTLPEEASEKRLFILGNGNKGWYIVEENPLENIWFREKTEEIDFEEIEEVDEALSDQIIYVLQEGAEGEKIVREKLTKTWSNGTGTTEPSVVSEEVITEATPQILVFGKKPVADIETQVTGLVEQYLTSYQTGQYAELLSLAPTAANFDLSALSQVAGFEIVSFEVSPPNEIRAIKPTEDNSQRGDLASASRYDVSNASLKFVREPFLMEAEVPVRIKYKLFSIELDFNDFFRLRASPEQKVWTMPFWGVTAAAKVNAESATLEGNVITLDGVVTMANSTLMTLTSSEHSHQITAAYEGNSEYANCIQFPRCFVLLNGFPQSDTFSVILESGILGYGNQAHEFNVELTK